LPVKIRAVALLEQEADSSQQSVVRIYEKKFHRRDLEDRKDFNNLKPQINANGRRWKRELKGWKS